MAATSKSGKKVVRVESTATPSAGGKGGKAPSEPTWTPTPEAKGKANKFRFIAIVLWLIAIGIEAAAIFWVLKQDDVNMVLLIGAAVVMAALSITGSILWKKANDADPARRSQPVKFFIQNQLGAIIAVIAFLPLVIMIFTNKNMTSKERNVAGSIVAVLGLIAVYFGIDFSPSSVEQYTAETARVVAITGADEVFWTKSGEVYHLCEDANDVNLESEDNQIYSGTVGDAHANGKERLTLKVDQEMDQCGFTTVDPGLDAVPEPAES